MNVFGSLMPHCNFDAMSFRFSPPDCYQLSSAETYSLLRIHLPSSKASNSPWLSPCSILSINSNSAGLPQLISWLPVYNRILNHMNDLIRYWASLYFAKLPVIPAVSGSLSLCTIHFLLLPSNPAVASYALAIRINFPLIKVLSPSFRRPGLPALLGKQKAVHFWTA